MGDEFPEGDNLEQTGPLPANLRFLRVLVTVLTAVMILGVIAIVALLVIRLNDTGRDVVLVHPGEFAMPEGVGVVGYSVVDGLTVIVGDDGVIRVFSSDTLELVREMDLGD